MSSGSYLKSIFSLLIFAFFLFYPTLNFAQVSQDESADYNGPVNSDQNRLAFKVNLQTRTREVTIEKKEDV